MASNFLTLLFAAALVSGLMVKFWLATRQMRYVAAHRVAVPPEFAGTVTLAAHQKAADYTLAKGRLGLWTASFSTAVLLGWTLLGGLAALNAALLAGVGQRWGGMAYQLALIGAVAAIGAVLDMPWSLCRTFRLEQRFGFNRMTWQLALSDAFKGLVVAVIVGGPAAALVLWLMQAAGGTWWLWAFGAWASFNLLMLVVYPTWIAPLFNTFSPLDDVSLRERIDALLTRCGFAVSGFFVMDGSRRSAHGNAYFTGLGRSKRVVFFDTLLAKLTATEMVAVLAHELGHFKHRHVVTRMVLMFSMGFVALALLGWLSGQAWFYTGLGVPPSMQAPNNALALLLFALATPPFLFFASPWFAALSRRQEYEADAYACAQADGADLRTALLKLHQDNASTLTPDPLFVRFYYSHPRRLPAWRRWPHVRRARHRRRALLPRRDQARPRLALPSGGWPVGAGRRRLCGQLLSHPGFVVSAHGRHAVVEDASGRRLLCHARGKKSSCVVGDRVQWNTTGDEGVIESVERRRNLLFRQDEWKIKAFAANLDQILVVVAGEPVFSESQLGRALVAAEDAAITARVLLNKCDLPQAAAARRRLAPYATMGYDVIEVALKADPTASLTRLQPLLNGKVTLVLGPSGSGKSTLINVLVPDARAQVGDISHALNSGRHTTTSTHWHWLDAERSGALIDSPGFQEFGLRQISADRLAGLMPDLAAHAADCRFYNCTHLHEPGCAVQAAAARGEIAASRMAIYAQIRDELAG